MCKAHCHQARVSETDGGRVEGGDYERGNGTEGQLNGQAQGARAASSRARGSRPGRTEGTEGRHRLRHGPPCPLDRSTHTCTLVRGDPPVRVAKFAPLDAPAEAQKGTQAAWDPETVRRGGQVTAPAAQGGEAVPPAGRPLRLAIVRNLPDSNVTRFQAHLGLSCPRGFRSDRLQTANPNLSPSVLTFTRDSQADL